MLWKIRRIEMSMPASIVDVGELEKCPFCGEKPKFNAVMNMEKKSPRFFISCCKWGTSIFHDAEELKRFWNDGLKKYKNENM